MWEAPLRLHLRRSAVTPYGGIAYHLNDTWSVYSLGRRVPRTRDSPRAHALANAILELHDSLALREKAKAPITLQQAIGDSAPGADYLHSMALKSD